ncbi:hypothetical protein IMZ48_24415 [Candidatus Bathyarchaeota archaeon]|nr:hypothetical protein [Candidatus Bathyarchaeota archaeon]
MDKLIAWQESRKKWHHDKTRQKMAAESNTGFDAILSSFNSTDFGLDQGDLDELGYSDSQEESESEEEEADEEDPIEAERRRRAKKQDKLRRRAGEPDKPDITEIHKMQEHFIIMLREVLAE